MYFEYMFAFSAHRVLISMIIIETMKCLINQHGIPCIRRHTSRERRYRNRPITLKPTGSQTTQLARDFHKAQLKSQDVVEVKVAQLRLCNPMDYTVHEILQARILEWVAFPFSRISSQPRDRTQAFCIGGGFFTS